MHIVILIILVLAVLLGPQWWAQHVLKKYARHRDDFPGNGSQFAQHLLTQFGMQAVKIEQTTSGDHYDPMEKVVRLSEQNMQGKSLTAIVVAAHETGHAMQDLSGYRLLKLRTRMVLFAGAAEKIGYGLMIAVPVVSLIARTPVAGGVILLIGVASMLLSVLVHFVTLPVEWDASFSRALPVLKAGNYLSDADMKAAHRILTACALTYLAASLMSLVNVYRWFSIFRR